MILKRTLTFENQNLKRCKIDSEIDYGSKKGEIMVYKKRQRATVDQPCSREPELLTSSSSSLTSKESQPCSDQSKSSRGRVRAVPSRFKDSIVGSWKSSRRILVMMTTYLWGRSEVDCDYWDVKISMLSSADDARSGTPKKSDVTRKGVYKPEEFTVGDLVWAKCGKRFPAWPAVVIDPISQAPDGVLKHCVPGAICVMFFGYSKNGTQTTRNGVSIYGVYGQDQTNLYNYKPSEFKKALDEAVLAENGVEGNCGDAEISCPDSSATESDQDYGPASRIQARLCMGKTRNLWTSKFQDQTNLFNYKPSEFKNALEEAVLAENGLRKSNQYCGICKRMWHPSDDGDWVCCDGCDVWVHAGCDNISNKHFKEVEHNNYYCPNCKVQHELAPSILEEQNSVFKSTEKATETELRDEVTVVCNGMEGTYIRKFHAIECKWGSCGSRKQSPSEWERHTGCRAKKCKSERHNATSRKMEFSTYTLETQMLDKQKMLSLLEEKYEPVRAKWATERCAVCRWVVDWEKNKMIICNRCQVAVHQECYGVSKSQDLTSWMCRACETPDIERECCLCHVKGGAVKPSDVEGLWVHVTCTWFRPEVGFLNHENMEPAIGLFKIPANSFLKLRKSNQYCGICKRMWHPSDDGDWVCCDGCDVWVHAGCDNISNKHFKEVEHNNYYCPNCKVQHELAPSILEEQNSVFKSTEKATETELRDENLVQVGFMWVKEEQSPSEWERHTGCRAKKWKYSVRVKDTMLPLEKWIGEFSTYTIETQMLDKQKMLSLLEEKYEPVSAKWTTERCAVCRWVEDWEENKMIICNRCQVAVHQECYGVSKSQDLTSWVCRACETPDIERDCCLCPVKGQVKYTRSQVPTAVLKHCVPGAICVMFFGYMKNGTQSDYAWVRQGMMYPFTEFMDKFAQFVSRHMVPACIAASVPPLPCNVCVTGRLQHGVALPEEKWCAENLEISLVFFLQNQNRRTKGSRLVMTKKVKLTGSEIQRQAEQSGVFDFQSAARCLIYSRSNTKKIDLEAIYHRLKGPSNHSLGAIENLNSFKASFSFRARFIEGLKHFQRTENFRVCFGKLGIHGWGKYSRSNGI
ncbi:unnamed protein product [Arabidopsis arenosa]|uniref:PHD-type domain-containing protein n=1 Tax=Arabidopsis arenosa TaxID=38785 RepID=A0A8S2ADC1_ARAAE|nr:unnamed protein product [Arabidopsis arenosa]